MLKWALSILFALAASDQVVRGLAPGESSPIPDIQTHYGTSTVKLHITVERVDHVAPEDTAGHAEVTALHGAIPPHFQ